MSEPLEATTLDDLSDVVFTIEIPRPDGKNVRVKMRSLGEDEAWQIRKSITYPKPPIIDYHKINGEALPVYDYAGEGYRQQSRAADQELSRQFLAASLLIDIPGATLKDKAALIEKKIGQWAFSYLLGVINRVNIVEAEAVDKVMRSFRSDADQSSASDNGHALYTEPVA